MFFMRLALGIAARHPAPDTIPRNGPRTVGLDCYTTYVHGFGGDWSLLVDKVDSRGVSGRLLYDGMYQLACTMLWPSLKGASFEFTHYIGPYEFRYDSVGSFLRAQLLSLHRYWIYRERIEQFFFNRRRLARTERIAALRLLLENALNRPQYRTSTATFLAEIHTRRSFLHPDRDRQLAYARLLLDSLADSGDLRRIDHGYEVAPRALSTLARHEEEDRRHRDSVRQQWVLAVLTFGLIVVGVIQVVVAYLGK